MRRALVLALSCAVAAAVPALAADAPKGQTVAGSVAAPVALVARVPRTLAVTDRSSNGLTGYAFDVDPATVGGPFALDVADDPTGLADLQIGFYSSLGSASEAGTVAGEFIGADASEKGYVPEGAKVALVYLANGAQVGFDYTATPPASLGLSAADLDLTVAKGSAVRWTNDTTGVLSVVGPLDADGVATFESGDLEPGASFTQPFPDAGTYAYTVGDRTGTVTVTG
ncbi:MAG: hypothetical protein JWO60_1424 [Frankiales bacterium]|nr:hypothetical protein [Frankiales bacterium]